MVERFSITLRVNENDALGELLLRGEFDFSAARGVVDTAASAMSKAFTQRGT